MPSLSFYCLEDCSHQEKKKKNPQEPRLWGPPGPASPGQRGGRGRFVPTEPGMSTDTEATAILSFPGSETAFFLGTDTP